MKLMIAVPTYGNMPMEFCRSLTGLVKRLTAEGVSFDVVFKPDTLVYLARDHLVMDAINGGYTHTLWLDSDMVFDDDLLEKLTAHRKAFVCGVYHTRQRPYESCVFTKLDPMERPEEYPDDVFQVEACGLGAVFIETRIMKKVLLKNFCCFAPFDRYGEDVAFCVRARELGATIWCEPKAVLGHVGQVTVWPDKVKALREGTK